jgi:hypothetical protein
MRPPASALAPTPIGHRDHRWRTKCVVGTAFALASVTVVGVVAARLTFDGDHGPNGVPGTMTGRFAVSTPLVPTPWPPVVEVNPTGTPAAGAVSPTPTVSAPPTPSPSPSSRTGGQVAEGSPAPPAAAPPSPTPATTSGPRPPAPSPEPQRVCLALLICW